LLVLDAVTAVILARAHVRAVATVVRASRAYSDGETSEAEATLVRVASGRAEPIVLAMAYGALARIANERGDFARAAALASTGLALAKTTAFPSARPAVEPDLIGSAAFALAAAGDPASAARILDEAVADAQALGARAVGARILVAMKRNEPREALELVSGERPLLYNGLTSMEGCLVAALESLALTKVGAAYRGDQRPAFPVPVDDATRAYIVAAHAACADVLG
jgi:hypothetical protein